MNNKSVAEAIGILPGNLSSCRSGKKRPGKEIIDKFYSAFSEKLKKLGPQKYDTDSATGSESRAEEPLTTYAREDMAGGITSKLVDTVIANNEKLWINNDLLWKDKEKIWATFNDMYHDNKEVIHELLRNNTLLVDRIPPRSGSSNIPPDQE